MEEAQFHFDDPVSWKVGTKQQLHGSEYEVIKPLKAIDEVQIKQLEYDILTNNPILFGTNTHFKVGGRFEKKAAAGEWETMVAADSADVILVPNWLEVLIQSFDLYFGNQLVRHHDISSYVPAFINMMLYSTMDKEVKKYLCPEDTHPARCVPTSDTKWEFANGLWTAYAAEVLKDEAIKFSWIPLFTWPLHQAPNFLLAEGGMKALPALRNMGKLSLRITFKDSFDCIWRKRLPANTNSYRWRFTQMDLALQEARVNPAVDRLLFSPTGKSKVLHYPGVTQIMKAETITATTFFYNVKFEKVAMPESLLVVALPKKVVASTYSYNEHTAGNPQFLVHNIESVSLDFDGEPLHLKQPNIGDLGNSEMRMKRYLDNITFPPFGLDIDQEKLTRSDVANSFAGTNFPRVYLNLCTAKDRLRIVPQLNSGGVLSRDCDFTVSVKFNNTGSTPDATYIFIICYTDFNLTLDLRTRKFTPHYNLK